jgi:hypothetical protein
MIRLTDYAGTVELELPIKIEFEGREYWIKKSTKDGKGIYLNTQKPPIEVEIKESDSVSISMKI